MVEQTDPVTEEVSCVGVGPGEALRRLRLEDCESKVSLDYVARPYMHTKMGLLFLSGVQHLA